VPDIRLLVLVHFTTDHLKNKNETVKESQSTKKCTILGGNSSFPGFLLELPLFCGSR
jgi:hypothetical protein